MIACYNSLMNETTKPNFARFDYEELHLLLEHIPDPQLKRLSKIKTIPARIVALIEEEIEDRRDDW